MVVIHYCYQTLTCSNYFRSCLLNFVYQHFGRDGSVKPLFRENIVDIAQEAKGSGHPLPVNEAHYSSLSHFEGSKMTSCRWSPKTDFS